MLVIADDVQKPEGQNAFTRPIATCLAAIGLLALVLPVKPSFAQAGGYVRVKIVKAGLLASGGIGNGVLTYRGRSYPFRGRFISSRRIVPHIPALRPHRARQTNRIAGRGFLVRRDAAHGSRKSGRKSDARTG